MGDLLDPLAAPTGHDPGGRRLPLPRGVVGHAVYAGPDDCYRHALTWTWDGARDALLFLGMNPSCAGHDCGDATLAKVTRLARRWGMGTLLVGNTFGYRAADQSRLAEVADPIGPDNDAHVLDMAERVTLILVGYGTPKIAALAARGPDLARKLVAAGHGCKMHALRIGANNRPWHPLYVAENTPATRWAP